MRLCNVCNSRGQYHAVVDFAEQAMKLSEEIGGAALRDVNRANALSLLGSAHFSLGQRELGIQRATEALSLSETINGRQNVASQKMTLGIMYSKNGQHEHAKACFESLLNIAKDRGTLLEEGHSLTNLACVYQDLRMHPQAVIYAGLALTRLETLWNELQTDDRRLTFGDVFVSASRMFVNSLAHAQGAEKALEAAERGRSRSLEMLLVEQRLKASIGLPSGTVPRPMGVLSVDTIRAFAARQRVAIVMFTRTTGTPCPELLVWVVGSKGGGVTCQRITIPMEAVSLSQLVELARRRQGAAPRRGTADSQEGNEDSDDNAAVLGLRNLLCDAMVPPEVDEDKLVRSLAALDDSDDEEDGKEERKPAARTSATLSNEPLRRCHQLFIEPIAAAIADEPHLLLLPDYELYALPFAALQDANGKYLIEMHTLSVAPSIGILIELEKRAISAHFAAIACRSGSRSALDAALDESALVVGDPNTQGRRDPLNGARVEAEGVVDLLERRTMCRVTHLTGDAATKAAVTAAMCESDYVHLATHGSRGGLCVAGATNTDGVLSMAEVQALTLRPNSLVVLSACNTFRGTLRTDGVVGVARAFLAAGASSLLASLWHVDDQPTRVLMMRFYERLLGQAEDNAAVALQGAMVSMLRDGYRPCEWAAFVVYGGANREPDASQIEAIMRGRNATPPIVF